MVRTVRPGGIVTGVAICLFLVICGCQKDRATAPEAEVEALAEPAVVAEPLEDVPAESAPQEVPEETPEPQVVVPEPNEAGPPVNLVLSFSPGQVATYRVTTEAQKSVEWVGPEARRPAGYPEGRSGNHIEITFDQRVEEVRDNGDAVLAITIRALKYVGQIESKVVFEFDSAKAGDPGQRAGRADWDQLQGGDVRSGQGARAARYGVGPGGGQGRFARLQCGLDAVFRGGSGGIATRSRRCLPWKTAQRVLDKAGAI